MTTCINCGNSFTGKFCSNCRQPSETHRITWAELAHQLPHALFHADMGMLYTLKQLAVRPGDTIREYLAGKRAYHFNPLLYLILAGGLASLLYLSFHVSPPNREINLEKVQALSGSIAYKYFALVGALFIILLSISDYLFYYRKKLLIPEIIISNTFQTGQVMVYTIAFFPVLYFQDILVHNAEALIDARIVMKGLIITFLLFTRYQLYEAKGKLWLSITIIIQIAVVTAFYNLIVTKLITHYLH